MRPRTSRAGFVSIVKTTSCGVFASRSKGGPEAVRGARARAVARPPERRARPWRGRTGWRVSAQGWPPARETCRRGPGGRRGRPPRRAASAEVLPVATATMRAPRARAQATSCGASPTMTQSRAREGVAEPAGLLERDRAELLAPRRLVAERPEREAVPEADRGELDARAALDVARQERGDRRRSLGGRRRPRTSATPGLEDAAARRRARPRGGRDTARGRRRGGGGRSPRERPRRGGAPSRSSGRACPRTRTSRRRRTSRRPPSGRPRRPCARRVPPERSVPSMSKRTSRAASRAGGAHGASRGARRAASEATKSGSTRLQYGQSWTPVSSRTSCASPTRRREAVEEAR